MPVTGTPAGLPARSSRALSPPVVPAAGTAYLGAFVDPSGQGLSGAAPLGGTGGVAAELAALPGVEGGLARPLSIVEVDQSWSALVDIAQLRRVAGTGAIPMITWECGDTDARVTAGADDALITQFAHELSSLGAPVMVRWFPDANGSGPATQGCLGAGGTAGYVAAFQHVSRLLAGPPTPPPSGRSTPRRAWLELGGLVPRAGQRRLDRRRRREPGPRSGRPGRGDLGVRSVVLDLLDLREAVAHLERRGHTRVPGSVPDATVLRPGHRLPAGQGRGVRRCPPGGGPDPAGPRPERDGCLPVSLARSLLPAGPRLVLHGHPNPRVQGGPGPTAGHRRYGRCARPRRGRHLCRQRGRSQWLLVPPGDGGRGLQPSTLPVGTDSIVALYSGDAAVLPSASAPLSVIVAPTPTPTTTVPSPSLASPAVGAVRSHAQVVRSHDPACAVPSSATSAGPGSQPAVPGPCQAYLGASVDPTGSMLSEPADLAALDQGLARPASIVQLDQAWTARINATQLEQVYATGAIPMISWSCGDLDSHVASGNDDAAIASAAQAMAATGIPILLQWYPDPGSYPGDSSKCLGSAGATGYVQAYRDIVRQFRSAGAGNVAFVWSVDTNDSPASTWSSLYPGDDFVDWIAADGFDRSTAPPTAGLVQNRFGAWYSAFSSSDKPLMISDTGAATGQQPSVQDTYLNLLASLLPTAFPMVKAVVYQDGPNAGPTGAPYDYTLDSAGLSALDSLSASPYFQPDQSATTTSVSVSSASPPEGKVVTITAAVAGSDLGGSVSFLDNGSPLAGCSDVQVLNASSCETSSLPRGANEITADYLGDAAYGPSTSAAVSVTVGAAVGEQGRPYVPPVGTAYLGAWVRPLPVTKQTPVNQELSTLGTFNSGLGRSLSVVHVYQDWTSPTPSAQLQKVLANGATPMIDWRCGPSDATILSGQDDALITGFATQLAQLKAPVFLRWFYEFNFPNSPDYKACVGSLGPAGYAAAFRHIHALFTAAGASNVSFVWCIASGGQDQDWIKYYPGPAYVDWIAVDGYLRNYTTYRPGQFAQLFGAWYSTFDSFGKPMMITETAALSGAQGSYLSDIQQSLDTGYPMIRGVLYFDAPGQGRDLPLPPGQFGLLGVPGPWPTTGTSSPPRSPRPPR